MSQIVLQVSMVTMSVGLYLGTMALNEMAFTELQEFPGVNWIFLPAGIRLLCTLLFGVWGVIGIGLATLFITTKYFFPDQWVYSAGLSFVSAMAPYLVYLSARHHFGLAESLINLSPQRLLVCCVAFGITSSGLHHFWFWLNDTAPVSLKSLVAMITGDIVGAIIVLYIVKMLLALIPRRPMNNPNP